MKTFKFLGIDSNKPDNTNYACRLEELKSQTYLCIGIIDKDMLVLLKYWNMDKTSELINKTFKGDPFSKNPLKDFIDSINK